MKKKIRKRLTLFIVAALFLFMIINYILLIIQAQNDMVEASQKLFWQIEQLVSQNSAELEAVSNDFRDICLLRARAAAYLLQYTPSDEEDTANLKKIAKLLDVDELHLFNQNGTIFAGTNPEYYGLNMNDGDQISFFLPMLEDKTLSLCQDVTPNTAEDKLMQYAAAWTEDRSCIVQVGFEPERVMELTQKNELSYIFSLLTDSNNSTLFAVSKDDYTVLGSTRPVMLEKKLTDWNVPLEKVQRWGKGFYFTIQGVPAYGVFQETDNVIWGRIMSLENLYANINLNNFRLAAYLMVIFGAVFILISGYLDKNIVRAISDINGELQKITEGDLDKHVDVNTTPEFTELSGHINDMVESLLETTDKLSFVLDATQLPIGVYEYSAGMGRVLVTSRVPEILGLSSEQEKQLFADYKNFENWLIQLRKNALENGIYRILRDGETERYIKMESLPRSGSVFGIVIDVTDDVLKNQQLEQELGQDELTKLCSRRSFYSQVEQLFAKPEQLKNAAIIMIDSDDLKKINDNYGHEYGDRYLCKLAETLNRLSAPFRLIARLSGDEFAILLYNSDTKEDLQRYIQELKYLRDNAMLTLSVTNQIPVRFSIGTAFYPADGDSYQLLLKYADREMYKDKEKRKAKSPNLFNKSL